MATPNARGSAMPPEDRDPPLPARAAELQAALRDAVDGEVRFSHGDRAMYAFDASIFRQVPIGVVLPAHADDAVAALEVCRRFDVPVLGRGGGTALAGQTVNAAVVFDFSKYMDAITEIDPQARWARVQPGVVCDRLREAAEEHGLTFGPDPATHDHVTLGGMIGNNSCGTHSIMAGKTVDNIDELEVITYDGVRMRVGATGEEELESIIAAGGRRGQIYADLKRIRDTYADVIRNGMPDIPRRVSGYNLDWLLPENGFHVARALVGSEGTLALTLGATCRLVYSPPQRSLIVLGYPDIPSSGADIGEIMGFEPIGVEFTSRIVTENLQAKEMRFGAEDVLPDGDAWLLVEFGDDAKEGADAQAAELAAALDRRDGGPAYRLCEDPGDAAAVWAVRRHSAGTARMPVGLGGHGGWPNWEDAAVAPERLEGYLGEFVDLLERYSYTGVFYGHWGHGCVHCRIDFDLRTAEGVRDYRSFMEEAADLVVSYGGSLSGEHGDGHGRAELWPKMFPPDLMAAFTEFKQAWDPDHRMNPHKLIDPYPLDSHLREGVHRQPRELETVFAYQQDGGSFAEAAGRCFGVGKCRRNSGGVMCPSYMVTGEEKHSTRGRARLLQEMAESSGPVTGGWRDRDVKDALDLCLACKGCKSDCPTNVDMATYKAEFLHHHYAGRIRPRQAYALGLIDVWASLGSRMPGAVNAAARAPVLGNLIKFAGGVAQEREVPRFAEETFTRWFDRRTPADPGAPPVLLWPDTFTDHFEPHVGKAAVEVLEAAGFQPLLPVQRLCCGRPLYDYGMLTLARRYLIRVLRGLRSEIRAGIPLVGLEPSCLAVFRDELGNLFPRHPDAQRLRAQSYALSEFLAEHTADDASVPRLHRRALVQPHCHHQSVLGFDTEHKLLKSMGLDVEIPDSGCCGMAGSFGFEAGRRYEVAMAAGERVLLPKVREAEEDTLIIADGFSCRGQIASGTGRTGLHLAEVMAMALREQRDGRSAPSADAEAPRSKSRA